jgi:hypothetical protein
VITLNFIYLNILPTINTILSDLTGSATQVRTLHRAASEQIRRAIG